MFNLNNADMENLFTQINKERLVDSNTALMMKELYYYALCEYWYDKLDRLHTDTKGRNTPMYMCECPTLAACIQWMIQTREYTFQTEQNGMVWHVVVKAGDYVLYDSESNADSFCCLEEALEKAVQECMELFSKNLSPLQGTFSYWPKEEYMFSIHSCFRILAQCRFFAASDIPFRYYLYLIFSVSL